MADFESRLERELLAAATRTVRLRFARSRVPVAPTTLACAVIFVVAVAAVAMGASLMGSGASDRSTPREAVAAPPSATRGGGFAQQLALLEVLRHRTRADDDPQVRATVREYAQAGQPPRADYARLLGKAPSGSAFVLLPVRHFPRYREVKRGEHVPADPAKRLETIRDGLCLVRRGTQGGAGTCVTSDELRSQGITGALAGQLYGVVPDGVASVRLTNPAVTAPVRRNFWVMTAPQEPAADTSVQWLDADGRVIGPR